MIEILVAGPVNSVQDAGRFGYRSQGVSTNGAMDPLSMRLANLLVGNPETTAVVEIQSFPFRLRFLDDRRFAVAGAACPMRLDGQALPSNWTGAARAGQELEIDRPGQGARAYLALAGGLDVPEVLGSRSTHLRNNFGGFEGRDLRAGDKIAAGTPPAGEIRDGGLVSPLAYWSRLRRPSGAIELRAVPGADYEMYTPELREEFWTTEWRITPQSNRSGFRLRGAAMLLPKPVSLYSYGVVPGIIQVPPSGEPIIQMADANSAGGYPRLGGVIEADLWMLGQAPVGSRVRFTQVSFAEAAAALAELEAYLDAVRAGKRLLAS